MPCIMKKTFWRYPKVTCFSITVDSELVGKNSFLKQRAYSQIFMESKKSNVPSWEIGRKKQKKS